MSTVLTLLQDCDSSDATEAFGSRLGHRLKGREVIELMSDLGGGKTTLTRGIVRGAGSHDTVSSPTFTLSKLYRAGRLHIYHFDFYRLDEAGLMTYELQDAIDDPEGVVIVEWGKIVANNLPMNRATITISKTGDSSRHIICTFPSELEYLFS